MVAAPSEFLRAECDQKGPHQHGFDHKSNGDNDAHKTSGSTLHYDPSKKIRNSSGNMQTLK